MNESCACKNKGKLVPSTEWSECAPMSRSTGCYSNTQNRNELCYVDEVQMTTCLRTRNCKMPESVCNGNWGNWESSSRCDCNTGMESKSRYCYTVSDNSYLQRCIMTSQALFFYVFTFTLAQHCPSYDTLRRKQRELRTT